MDSKDLEVAGTFKVLGYELTLDEALTLQMNLSTALNISYGEQHEAPAGIEFKSLFAKKFKELKMQSGSASCYSKVDVYNAESDKSEMQSVPDAVKDEIVYIRDSIDSPFEPVAPATGDTDFNDKWESVEEGVRGDGATETVSMPAPDFDAILAASVRRFGTVMAAGKEMDISNAHIPLAPVVDALKAEEANILKHEEWKSGWLKGMAEEMNKLTRECAANASR